MHELLYDLLKDASRRPQPFSRYTAADLWTRPHLAQQMLAAHLDPHSDRASYRVDEIDRIVRWLDSRFTLAAKRICDLGCGPGLYTQRFAAAGAEVTGIDFSLPSLNYAVHQAQKNKQQIEYLHADYLADNLPTGFDLVTLIFTDFCVLSPIQRQSLLTRIRDMLNPGGRLILDVASIAAFAKKKESTEIEDRLMDGFWAPGPYVGIKRCFLYVHDHLSLERYIIIEPDESWQVFNWFQYFTPDSLAAELGSAGFAPDLMLGGLSGMPLASDSELIGVVAGITS